MNIIVAQPDTTPKITVSNEDGTNVSVAPSPSQTVNLTIGIVGERGPEGAEPSLVDGGTFN